MKNKIKISVTALVFIIIFMSCQHQRSDMGNSNSNLFNMGYIASCEQKIYFCALTKGDSGIYKANLDGSNKTMITSEDGHYINVINEWVYYINDTDRKIYKVSTDGKSNYKISDIKASFLLAYKNKLYIIGTFEPYENNLFVMNTDGTEMQNICNEYVGNISIYNNKIYYTYSTGDNTGYLCRMDIDGNNNEILLDEYPIRFFPTEKNIYYITQIELIKMDLNSGEKTVLEEGSGLIPDRINFYENNLYYEVMARKFCVYNTKTDEIITMPYIGAENLHIVADKMFYLNNDGSFLTMNLDGSNKKTF